MNRSMPPAGAALGALAGALAGDLAGAASDLALVDKSGKNRSPMLRIRFM